MMSEFDSRSPGDFDGPEKANRFDRAASVPRSHTSAASLGRGAADGSGRDAGSEAVRDVSLETLLLRLDEALAAIRSLDEIGGEELRSDDVAPQDSAEDHDA